MAKMVLGKTPQELEAEKAKRAREMEAEIQQQIMERQKKIQALHSKQKSNKIIIFVVIFLIAAILITFGTYNTFFKKGLTMDEVNYSIASATQQSRFPSEGLDNYVRDNCEALFNKYMSLDSKRAKNIAKVEVDKNSCYIFKVRKHDTSTAEVYFSVDVAVTEKDTLVTDPVIIEQLKRNGFGVIPDAEVTPQASNQPQEPTQTVSENQTTEDVVENETTEENVTEEVTEETIEEVTEEHTTEAVVEEPVEENTDIPTTDIDFAGSQNEEAVHYYMTAGGNIMQSGKTTVTRYSFYLPLEYKIAYDTDGSPMYGGYYLMSDMNLYSLEEKNQTDFEEIVTHDKFKFDEATLVDDNTLHNIQIRVDKTLDSLYGYKNTEAEYKLYLPFNTYDASYDGIIDMMAYSSPNAMGYNTHVTYKITTSQGFSYTLQTYMLVEPDGNSWVIKKIM